MSNLGLLEFIEVNPQVVPLTAAKQVTVATSSVFVDRNHGREYHNYSKEVEHNHNSSLKRKAIERKSMYAQPGNSSGRNLPVQCLCCLFHCFLSQSCLAFCEVHGASLNLQFGAKTMLCELSSTY